MQKIRVEIKDRKKATTQDAALVNRCEHISQNLVIYKALTNPGPDRLIALRQQCNAVIRLGSPDLQTRYGTVLSDSEDYLKDQAQKIFLEFDNKFATQICTAFQAIHNDIKNAPSDRASVIEMMEGRRSELTRIETMMPLLTWTGGQGHELKDMENWIDHVLLHAAKETDMARRSLIECFTQSGGQHHPLDDWLLYGIPFHYAAAQTLDIRIHIK